MEGLDLGGRVKLIVPIMPGKTEAWRRFLQELGETHAADFAKWCGLCGIMINQILLNDSAERAFAIWDITVAESVYAADFLTDNQPPFNRWLHTQIQSLHGFDLSQLNSQISPIFVGGV